MRSPRHVRPEVRHQMAKVVLLFRANRAVGEEDKRSLSSEPADGVVRVDPRVHPLGRRELGARRPELGADDGGVGTQGGQEDPKGTPAASVGQVGAGGIAGATRLIRPV